jgi:hypothetical protein
VAVYTTLMSLLTSISSLPADLLRDIITKLDYITTLNLKSAAVSELGRTNLVLECERRTNSNIYINDNLCDPALIRTVIRKHNSLLYGSGPSNFYGHDSYATKGEWGMVVRRSVTSPSTIVPDMEKIGFKLQSSEQAIPMEPGNSVNGHTHYSHNKRPSLILDGPTVRSNIDVYNSMLTEQGQHMLKDMCCYDNECYKFYWDLYMITPTECKWPTVDSDYSRLPMDEGITMTKVHNGTTVRINIVFITSRTIDLARETDNFPLGAMMSYHCSNDPIVSGNLYSIHRTYMVHTDF